MTKDKTKLAYLAGIIGAICWGISFIGTKTGLDYLEPIQVMAVRMTIAILTFGVFTALGIIRMDFRGKSLKGVLILSISQPCLYGMFEIFGINLTTASESAILLSIVPVVVTLLSIFLFKEKVRLPVIGFICLSFTGVVVTVLGDVATSGKILGYIFLILAVLCASTYTLLSKKVSANFNPMEITFVMTSAGLIFFNGLNFLLGYGMEAYIVTFQTPPLLYALLFLGIVCSVFAFIAYNYLISRVPAYKASTVSLSIITVTGVIAGILFRNEPVTVYKIVGLVMILGGVIGASQPDKATTPQ